MRPKVQIGKDSKARMLAVRWNTLKLSQTMNIKCKLIFQIGKI